MTIIVEDGTIVSGANSYIDDAYIVSYASARGITIPATEQEREYLIINAMDYIESKRDDFKGRKTTTSQATQWPRQNVYIEGNLFDKNSIPEELKKAQAQAAIYGVSNELFLTGDGTNVKKEKLGDLEVEYFYGGNSGNAFLGRVDIYINVITKSGGKRTLSRI